MHLYSLCVAILFLVMNVESGTIRKHRSTRHSSEENLPSCEDVCEAQWKSDFQVHFQKIYDNTFFDVPIDGTIIADRQDLLQFCSLTEQKFACMKRECQMNKFEWTSDRHVCMQHLNDFKASIGCLKKTHHAVHHECNSFCQRAEENVSPVELRFIKNLSLSEGALIEQNRECLFISCHKMCHKHLIGNLCDSEEQEKAKATVTEYYDDYMKKYYYQFAAVPEAPIFSSFCRRVTPGADENKYIEGMTAINNQTIAKLVHGIRNIVSNLSH